MNTTRTIFVPRAKSGAILAAVIGTVFGISACGGGSDFAGEYYSEEGQLVIDDSSVNYYPFGCPEDSPKKGDKALIEEEPDAEGQLNDDETEVIWNSDDEHVDGDRIGGTMSIKLNTTGDTKVITFDDFEFKSGDEENAVSAYDDMC